MQNGGRRRGRAGGGAGAGAGSGAGGGGGRATELQGSGEPGLEPLLPLLLPPPSRISGRGKLLAQPGVAGRAGRRRPKARRGRRFAGGVADSWAASIRGRRAVLGQEVWGVQASAPVRLALLLCSVLLSWLAVSSVALTCPGVFLFPCSWDIPRGEERQLGVRGKILV